jgi:hypothetical protein
LAGSGRTYGEQHYSPLDQLNADSVSQLDWVWAHGLGPGRIKHWSIEIDGTIYLASRRSLLHAIDVKSGIRSVAVRSSFAGFFIDRLNGKLISAQLFAELTWRKRDGGSKTPTNVMKMARYQRYDPAWWALMHGNLLRKSSYGKCPRPAR